MDINKAMQLSSTGSEEELKTLVYHPSSEVILKLLQNKNLTEELTLIIAGRKNIDRRILESIYKDIRWMESYPIMLTLCKNHKTPQKISLSLLKSLRILDLADITRNKQIPINIRMKAEANICEKILTLPLGIKLTLAKKASSNVLARLIEDGIKEVVAICLESSQVTEGVLSKIISRKKISSNVLRQIASHPKWSCRYYVQWALILNENTPLACIVNFLKNIKTIDLKELYNTPELPSSTRPFIYRELLERNEILPNFTH
ncbi:MAG: hypothetical protein AB1610_10265 [Nitrospirota bacterium]